MAEPNIVKGQIALDPFNDLLYYVNESNTKIATSLSWLKNANNISTVENVVISGDLTVSGTTFTVNTETLLVEDNIIVVNSNYSGNAETDVNAKNAGIEVERGTQPNVFIRWNETTNKWQFSNDGTLYYNILGEGNVNLTLGTETTGNYVSSLIAGTGITLANNSGEGTTPTVAVDTTIIAPLASPTFTGTVSLPNNTVALGTKTTGDYVAHLVAGTGITLTNNSGETSTPTIAVTENTFDAFGAASTAANNAATALTNHENDTTNIHGIADTSILVTATGTQTLTNKTITSPAGLVKGDVGLGDVDNTSDANKPVSTATQTALNLKANLSSPTFTGTVTTPALVVGISPNAIQVDTTGATTGQVLKFDGTKFAPGTDDTTEPGALGSIDGHTDVTITSATPGQMLRYDGAQWVNDILTLNNIADFSVNNILSENEVLKFDGEYWVNSTIELGDNTTGAYVQSLVAGTGITISNNLGLESATPTIAVTANTFDAFGAAASATSTAATALTNHENDTTNIHGIADTSILVTTTGTQTLTNKTITSPAGLVKGDVGLGNVDNTSDANKPVSTAAQTALDLKAPLASPTFTGTVTLPSNTITTETIANNAVTSAKLADATIDIKTANYTLEFADKNKFIKMNVGSANTLTVPLASAAAFPTGAQIHIIQYGTGKTQIVATGGVTIYGTPGLYLRAQYSSATLLKCADTNVWMLMGDLSAS